MTSAPPISPPPPRFPELPDGVTPPADRMPRWPPWIGPLALLTGFGVTIMLGVVVGIAAAASGSKLSHLPAGVSIALTIAQDVALVGAALFFAQRVVRPRPWHFGLRPTRFWPAVGWLALGWLGFFVFSAIWAALLSSWGIHQHDKLPKELGANSSTAALVAVALIVLVIAPLAEEFFFRGFFFAALRSWKGFWPAALITGVVFGGIHVGSAPPAFLLPLAVFGFVLCAVYARTGSLYPCICLHALNNSIAFGVTQHYKAGVVIALMGGSLAAVSAVMLPLGRRAPRLA
ncbi:MAG TPA: type II CAAX endopeptidase family protein, partial [Solirubrobacteraceae bacterium]|nr:type II CAAX endopeptidase family protein [Solirubrobacteraceae bacterium]